MNIGRLNGAPASNALPPVRWRRPLRPPQCMDRWTGRRRPASCHNAVLQGRSLINAGGGETALHAATPCNRCRASEGDADRSHAGGRRVPTDQTRLRRGRKRPAFPDCPPWRAMVVRGTAGRLHPRIAGCRSRPQRSKAGPARMRRAGRELSTAEIRRYGMRMPRTATGAPAGAGIHCRGAD